MKSNQLIRVIIATIFSLTNFLQNSFEVNYCLDIIPKN